MNCGTCSKEARLIQFNTFSYYFCDTCKCEVASPIVVEDAPRKRHSAFIKSTEDAVYFSLYGPL